MSSPHYATAAARLLLRAPSPAPPSVRADERGLLTIQRALSARRSRRRRRAGWAVGLAVAAAVALSFGLRNVGSSSVGRGAAEPRISVSVLHGAGASVIDGAQHRALLRVGAAVMAGSRIETSPEGEAALRLSTGTEVGLDGWSLLTLQERGPVQRFRLEAGGLSAKVAKLDAGARFVIETPDAEVEVRGTQFHLAVLAQAEACAKARTRLLVQEGTVEVRSGGLDVLVGAGQRWPEACGGDEPPGPPPEPRATGAARVEGRSAARDVRLAAQARAAAPTSAVPAAPQRNSSDLVAQTELFAKAARAASRGEVAAALGQYQALIFAYPTSALAENAVVERMRLQKGAAAKSEAKRYLQLYPGGFGKSEATRILADP